MTKTYLATKAEVQDVADSVTTVNTQINTPSIGIEPRLATVENNQAQITTNKNDIATIRGELDDPTTGIYKQLTDIDTEINEADTGIKARLNDLESGGTTTMKFRTHTSSGVYEDGEIVQLNGSLWKANSAIDGSTTPVPFVVGTSGQTWSPASVHNFRSPVTVVADNNVQGKFETGTTGTVISSVLGNNGFGASFNYSRKRISIAATSTPSPPDSTDLIMLGDINGAASSVVSTNLTANRVTTSDSSGKLSPSVLEYSATVLNPSTHDSYDLGTAEKSFRGGYFQFVNFQSATGVNEGNVDADSGSLGIFGVTELALGYGNNNKDLTFTSSGLTLSKNMLVKNGNRITFQDGDTSNPEEVSMKMDGNDLTFYGKANTNAEVEVARLTYDGSLTAQGDISGANTTKVYSIYQQVTATAANITLVDNDQVRVKFIGTNVGGSNWFEVYNKSGVTTHMIWSSITDGASSSGVLNQTNGNGLTIASPTSTSGERTISVYIVGRNSSGYGLKGVVVDIAMKWASTSYAVGVVKVSGAY